MKNALTIDIEDWFQTHDLDYPAKKWASLESRIEYSTKLLLDNLELFKVRGTFFILGWVAQRFPSLIREIVKRGHEIGSHGGWHQKVTTQSKNEFRIDIVTSKIQLEDLTGQEIQLYRAPSWSVSLETLWALEILEEEGFLCDSSIQPFHTPLSGIKGAPVHPYYPVINNKKLNIIEFPPSVLSVGSLKVPFAGGLYFRLLPYAVIKQALKQVNKKHSAVIYFHPWEFDPGQPRLLVSPMVQLTHYYNLENNLEKTKTLLQEFNFIPLGQLLAIETKKDIPALPVTAKKKN